LHLTQADKQIEKRKSKLSLFWWD